MATKGGDRRGARKRGTATRSKGHGPERIAPDLSGPPARRPHPAQRTPRELMTALGLSGGTRALQSYAPLRDARMLVAAAANRIGEIRLADYVDESHAKRPLAEAPSWPVAAIRVLSAREVDALEAFGVKTVADLSEVGRYAEQVIASGREDNGFSELPSAPAELLPTIVGAVATSKRYSTFVREIDVTGLRMEIDEKCLDPLPLSAHPGKPASVQPSLGSILTGIRCPVFSLGYLLDHRQDWINLGTYLGEVTHSLSLAPGESRNIALVDWTRRQKIARQEDTDIEERLTSHVVHNRVLDELTSAVAGEHQFGGTESETSTATTAASFVGAGAVVGAAALGVVGAVGGGIIGSIPEPGGGTLVGAALGGAAGAAVGGAAGAAAGGLVYSGSQALGRIHSSSEGDREITADIHQRITQSTVQNSSLERSLWSTVVVEESQAEQVAARTSNITNYNHMHTLNIEYYEVLQHYLSRVTLARAEPVLYLPFTFMDFTGFTFVRDYWDTVRGHIADEGLRAQGDLFFVDEGTPPSSPDLLPEPPVPVPPAAADPARITGLKIDVMFRSHGILPSGWFTDMGLAVLKDGAEIQGDENPDSLDDEEASGYDLGNRYSFESIEDAHLISSVVVSRNQTLPSDVEYKIRVHSGRLKSGDVEVDNLQGAVIATNQTFRADDTRQSIPHSWRPASDFEAGRNQEMWSYAILRSEYDSVVAENRRRQAAFDELTANFERFKERLDKLIRRRRHYFTRVILNALEPEQVRSLLENVWIRAEDGPDTLVPLRSIAHVIPIAMTSGAFVMRMRRHTEEWRKRLERYVPGPVAPELAELLTHPRRAAALEREAADHAVCEQVYLPTGGLFAEGLLGRANTAEYMNIERYFDWQSSPIPHQPTPIAPVDTGSRYQHIEVSPTDPGSHVNVINAPQFERPGDILAAIQNGNLFRDMSKAAELTTSLGNLMDLSGRLGESASQMTGNALEQTVASATEIGKAAAGMTQQILDQALQQTGGIVSQMTQQGAALNAVKKDIPAGPEQQQAIKDALGLPSSSNAPAPPAGAPSPQSPGGMPAPQAPGAGGGAAPAAPPANPNLLPAPDLPAVPSPGTTPHLERVPSPAGAAAGQNIRDHLTSSGGAPDPAQIAQFGLDWYQQSVLPRLQQASNDDRFLAAALGEWLDWRSEMATLGVDSSNFAGPPSLAGAESESLIWAVGGLRNAVLQSQQRAVATNSIEYLRDALDWSANAEILGLADDANRLGVNHVLEDFPLTVEIFDVQYPPAAAVGATHTFAARAAGRLGANPPLVGTPVQWSITVTKGTVSGLAQGQTNADGGFATVITRDEDAGFRIEVGAEFVEGNITLAAVELEFEPPIA